MNRNRGLIFAIIAAFAVFLALPNAVCLADTGTYGNLTVSIDEPLAGDSGYGYSAFRVTVSNRSKVARRVRIQIPADSYGYGSNNTIDRMTHTVDIEPGAVSAFEMLQPPLPIQGNGAAIYIDGARQRRDIHLNVGSHMGYNSLPLVLVSRDVGAVLIDKIETAIEEDAASGTTKASGGYSRYGGRGGYGGNGAYTLAREPRPVVEWGTHWLGYTRYMAVMLTDRDLASMSPELSDALRSYVLTGGALAIVYSSGEPPKLAQWSQDLLSSRPMPPDRAIQQWSTNYGLGRIWMNRADTVNDWEPERWITKLDQWKDAAQSRTNVRDTENANRDFPVVEGQVTPARGLLLVMFLFAVVIGPVNVVVLWLLKRRMLLLLTVPVIALIFSAAVMVYALISEGITPQARTRSVTLLDQRSHQAVTVGVSGYYAPLTPANGLWFDENTSITPQVDRYGYGYYGSSGGRSRAMDTTHGQRLVSGWVAARIPAHFVLRKSERRRERLEIATEDDGTISVVNGLGSDITRLILVDSDGIQWTALDIPAGQSVSLTRDNSDPDHGSLTSVAELIRRDDWSATNVISRNPSDFLNRGSYYAQVSESPFLDPGLEGLKEHRTNCIVLGYFGEGG